MKLHHQKLLPALFLLAFALPACAPQVTEIPALPETPASTPPPAVTPTPTPAARSLTVCLGEEPNTLYPYGNLNSAARSVLSAIYDGPLDVVDYEYEAIILEKVPNIEDGDAQVSPITVSAGTEVVDASGNLVLLSTGVKVHPSGCRSEDCAITYDGSSTLEMDQLVVTFTMLEGLMWSDGEPLTTADSIYSFTVASDIETPGSKFLIDRTQTYEAADDQTVQWWGKPGFIDPDYQTNFWMPLPEHLWSQFTPAELLRVDIASRMPVGWGPYILDEWEAEKSLHLVKNLNYFRADSNLRGYDMILNASGGAEINWQRARLGITGRMVCIGISSGVKDGKRNFFRIATAALRTPRISVLKLFNANTGIYAINALHVLSDPTWIDRLTKSMTTIETMGLQPHIGKVFPAAEVGAAHAFLQTKQATGKVLLQWN